MELTVKQALEIAHTERFRSPFGLPVAYDIPLTDFFSEDQIMEWEASVEQTRQAVLVLAYEVHRLRGESVPSLTMEDFFTQALYLRFLKAREARISVQALREVVADHGAGAATVHSLLTDSHNGWRPHLVACVLALMGHCDDPKPFWDKLFMWPWVAPQIVATLSIIDPEFEAQAETCLNDRNWWIDPAGRIRNPKTVQAMLGLLAHHPQYAEWRITYGDGTQDHLGWVSAFTLEWRDNITRALA